MKKDVRVNAKSMTFLNYLTIFVFVLFFCGSYAGVYFLQRKKVINEIYVILSMFTYIAVISLTVCFMFAWLRKKFLMQPVYKISEAARKVTQGDFSVRIPVQSKGDKKDEFDVLFEDFNLMVEELASTEMMKTDFISSVSHELKTPLSVIQNHVTILQSDILAEAEKQEYLQRIFDVSYQLSGLVTNILQLSRLENQAIKPVMKRYNLSEQLSSCILVYDSKLEEKQIEIETDFDQNLILDSEEKLLDIVWNNLLSNAIKFTPSCGKIYISAKREGDFAIVVVRDTGCGMDKETTNHIFNKFYQGDASHATEGNGLGLSLVNRIVSLLDGRIAVESKPQSGSSFTVKLKLK